MTAGMPSAPPEFSALVAAHERDVLRQCRSVLRDEHLGADAAQETFVRLWRELQRGARPVELGAWLRRAALSCALDLRRNARRFPRAARRDADEHPQPVSRQGYEP